MESERKINSRTIELDVIRGLAVTAILVLHYVWGTGILRNNAITRLDNILVILADAVDVFFVLSGYFIGKSLIASKGKPGYFKGFMLLRAGRIFPLYYIFVGAFLILRTAGASTWSGGFPYLFAIKPIEGWSYLFFIQNWRQAHFVDWGPAWLGITWSLAIEMQFYLIAMIFVAVTPRRALLLGSLGVMLFSIWLAAHLDANLSAFEIHVLTPTHLDTPFLGIVIACLSSIPSVRQIVQKNNQFWRVFAICLFMSLYVEYAVFQLNIISPNDVPTFFRVSFKEVARGLLILVFAISFRTRRYNIFELIFGWIGKRCFSIYLIHMAIIGLVANFVYSTPPYSFPGYGASVIIPALIITFVLASISWRFLEEPIVRMTHETARYWQTPPTTTIENMATGQIFQKTN